MERGVPLSIHFSMQRLHRKPCLSQINEEEEEEGKLPRVVLELLRCGLKMWKRWRDSSEGRPLLPPSSIPSSSTSSSQIMAESTMRSQSSMGNVSVDAIHSLEEYERLFAVDEDAYEQPTTTRKELWSYYLYYNGGFQQLRKASLSSSDAYSERRRQRCRTRFLQSSSVSAQSKKNVIETMNATN